MMITDAVLDEPSEPPGSAFPPGLGFGSDGEGPQDAFAMPVRESAGRPGWVYVVAGVLVLVVAVVAFNLVFGGDDAPPPVDTDVVTAEQATATMCGHVQQIQTFRDAAFAAAAKELAADADVLRELGERRTAKQVTTLIAAIEGAREALATQQDTAGPFAKLRRSMTALPC
jgi:hypothetical protein